MAEFSLFNIATVVIVLAAGFGYLNHRWLKMPPSIGMVVIALLASFGAIGLDTLFPSIGFAEAIRGLLAKIDFHEFLMKGILSFLLFAGALHVNLEELAKRKWAIGTLASVGVLTSTFLVAGAVYVAAGIAGMELPFIYCLVFGALISPTDPVAVLGILKTVKVPDSLKAKIAGESLFNDGVGVVIFSLIAAVAAGPGLGQPLTAADAGQLLLTEALGGAALGLAFGYVVYRAMKSIDDYSLEVLLTLARVMSLYTVAFALHVSGPIAVVVAGILIGNHGTRFAMSETTRDHLTKFWSLLDEILNAALFLLIGFVVIALNFTGQITVLMIMAVPVVLLSRFISVALPLSALRLKRTFTRGAIPVLTWGGLRGGISVALALSLPDSPYRDAILAMTYGVVVFSIVVQGLTVKHVIRWLVK